MQLTNALLALTAAAAVTGHPSMAGHRHHHERRTPMEHFRAVKNTNGGSGTPAPPPPSPQAADIGGEMMAAEVKEDPTTTATTPAESTPTPETSTKPTGSGGFGSCQATSSYANSKRATLAQIKYTGELGSPYGCNWRMIDPADASLYDYKITFESPDYDITCQCWNKMGPDGESTGQWQDMLKINLPKGSTKVVALMADTQGSCGCSYGDSVPKGQWGDWLGTWVEMDMGSGPNDRQSGADVSALAVMDNEVKNGIHHDFPGMKIFANDRFCSGITANSEKWMDAYVLGNDAPDGTKIHDVDGLGCTGYKENNLRVLIGDVSW